MSEKQNTELIHSVYDAFSRGDIPFILGKLTSDTVWNTEGPATIPYTGVRKGENGVVAFFQALGGTLENMKLTTEHLVAQGDQVTTFGRFAGTVKATGKRFDAPVAHHFRIQDGKIATFLDIVETASIAAAYQATASAAR